MFTPTPGPSFGRGVVAGVAVTGTTGALGGGVCAATAVSAGFVVVVGFVPDTGGFALAPPFPAVATCAAAAVLAALADGAAGSGVATVGAALAEALGVALGVWGAVATSAALADAEAAPPAPAVRLRIPTKATPAMTTIAATAPPTATSTPAPFCAGGVHAGDDSPRPGVDAPSGTVPLTTGMFAAEPVVCCPGGRP